MPNTRRKAAYERVLKELLIRFKNARQQDDVTIDRFALAGALALTAEDAGQRSLTLKPTADCLGMTTDKVRQLVEAGELLAERSGHESLRFRRIDVTLYRAGLGLRSYGAAEGQIVRLPAPPVDEKSELWDAHREITPG